MNDQLLQSAGVRFLPWQGANYKEGLRGGRRLLVLGDSNYFSNDDPAEDCYFNRYLIKKCIEGDGYGFYNRLHDLFNVELRKFCTKTEGKYWAYDFISFYNYLTSEQLKHGSGGQKAQMYYDSEPAMIAVLGQLKPTHVLILGKKVWNRFLHKSLKGEPARTNWKGVGKSFNELWKYTLENRTFLTAHVYHPSAHGRYSYSLQLPRLKPVISNFLSEEPL